MKVKVFISGTIILFLMLTGVFAQKPKEVPQNKIKLYARTGEFNFNDKARGKVTYVDSTGSLKGLKEIAVSVRIGEEADPAELRVEAIHNEIEKNLRMAGIRVVPAIDKNAVLEVKINPVYGKKTAACSVSVELHQPVALVRNFNAMFAITWNKSYITFGQNKECSKLAKQLTDETVTEFINAYLSVNPIRR